MSDILTQEQKQNIINLHWLEGTMEEHFYYKKLIYIENNTRLKDVYEKCVQEIVEKYGYGGTDYQWDWDNEDYEVWELDLMGLLDEKLSVGVYKTH